MTGERPQVTTCPNGHTTEVQPWARKRPDRCPFTPCSAPLPWPKPRTREG